MRSKHRFHHFKDIELRDDKEDVPWEFMTNTELINWPGKRKYRNVAMLLARKDWHKRISALPRIISLVKITA